MTLLSNVDSLSMSLLSMSLLSRVVTVESRYCRETLEGPESRVAQSKNSRKGCDSRKANAYTSGPARPEQHFSCRPEPFPWLGDSALPRITVRVVDRALIFSSRSELMLPTPNEHEQDEVAGAKSDGFESEQAEPSSISDFPTDLAPSFPAALPPVVSPCDNLRLDGLFNPGARIGEFELVAELGRGAFGCVFLARQTSLDRLVALKITADEGSEGRTLAQLEHENIVQVYSELVDVLSGYRLLCMQYVAGPTLQNIIEQLHGGERAKSSGSRILEIIDGLQLQENGVRSDRPARS
jgi:hypothetical protein